MANVKIKVNFYDEEQRKLIETNFPKDYDIIQKIANTTIEIPIEDFKTYSFFRHQCDHSGYKYFIDFSKISKNWGEYDLYFEFEETSGKFVNKYPERIEESNISGTLGVAGCLSVASHIYGFSQADWTNIGIQQHKDFDFKYSSSIAGRFINVEAKGSINENNALKSSSVSKHKADIIEKKEDKEFKKIYNHNIDTCLGIITVADRANELQSWLVDPIYENPTISPDKLRLLKRLYYYYYLLKLISKWSNLTLTLANRIKVLTQVQDFKSLDKVPLVNYNMDKIKISDYFIKSRAGNPERTIIGRIVIFSNRELYFIGIPVNILKLLVNQHFEEILSFHSSANTSEEIIDGIIPLRNNNIDVFRANERIKYEVLEDEKHINLSFTDNVMQNSAGLCITRLTMRQ